MSYTFTCWHKYL